VATPDNYLYGIEDEARGITVGMIWLARLMQGAKPVMFIYNFRIDEAHRRKGYGEQALLAAEGGPPLGSADYQLLTTLAERQLQLGQSVILDSVAGTVYPFARSGAGWRKPIKPNGA
jgi:hypothetical protein